MAVKKTDTNYSYRTEVGTDGVPKTTYRKDGKIVSSEKEKAEVKSSLDMMQEMTLKMLEWSNKGYVVDSDSLCSTKVKTAFSSAGYALEAIEARIMKAKPKMTQDKIPAFFNKMKEFFSAYEKKDFKSGQRIATEIAEVVEK